MKKFLLLLVGVLVAFAAKSTVTIRFHVPNSSWNKVNVWAWTDSKKDKWETEVGGLNTGDSWPGAAMTKDSDGTYFIDFKAVPQYLIFSHEGNDQTETIDYDAGSPYYTENGASHVIYFYDNSSNPVSTCYAWLWNTSNDSDAKNSSSYPGPAMTSCGYVQKGSNYYPAWSYTYQSLKVPNKVIVSKDYDNKLTADGATYTCNGFYTRGSSSAETGLTIVSEIPTTYKYALRGNFDGWKNVEFTEKDGTYTCTVDVTSLTGDIEFGVKTVDKDSSSDKLQEWGEVEWFQPLTSEASSYTSGKSYALYEQSTANTSNFKFDLTNVTGELAFALTVGDDNKPTSLTITGGKVTPTVDTYKYALRGNFDGWKNVEFTEKEGTYTCTLDVTSLTGDIEFGVRTVDKDSSSDKLQEWNELEWFQPLASVATSYVSEKSYHLYKKGTANAANFNFDFTNISGTLTFTLSVGQDNKPTSLKISGGTVTPAAKTYKVYFYDTSSLGDIYASYDNGSTKEKMKENGKYVYAKDNQCCPVWEIEKTSTAAPANVRFYSTSGSVTANLSYKNGFYYTNNGSSSNTVTPSSTSMDPDMVYLYMHFKEDYLKQGKAKHDVVPKCHVFEYGTSNALHSFGDGAEEMDSIEGITSKYQIWRYGIRKEVLDNNNYNDVTFYFYNDNNGGTHQYTADKNSYFDKYNWSKFIYATQSDGKACQTFKTFDEFMQEAQVTHTKAYVIGTDQLSVDGTSLPYWDIRATRELTADDGCFYMELVPTWTDNDKIDVDGSYNNKQQVGFKVSWMNPARPSGYDGYDDDQRYWATYDLGIIGVNDLHPNISDYADLIVAKQYAVFSTNRSVPYLKYNQYNWTIVNKGENVDKYYAVIDTHDTCGSVTLCSFNPQPSVEISKAVIGKVVGKVDGEAADNMAQNEYFRGNIGEANKAHFEKVNKMGANADIQAVEIEQVTSQAFTRQYVVSFDGVTALDVNGDDGLSYKLDYMPFSFNGETSLPTIAIRAFFTDINTGLSFHSRTSAGTYVDTTPTFQQPNAPENLDGQYIFNRTEDGESVYDLYVSGLTGKFDPGTDYNAYVDYMFYKGNDTEHPLTSTLILYGDTNYTKLKNLNINVPEVTLSEGQNWSEYLKTGEAFPVLIKDAAKVETTASLPPSINCSVFAVYPFIYDSEVVPTLCTNNGASAPRRVEASDAEAANVEAENQLLTYGPSYYITTGRKAASTIVNVNLNETVSGIEAVNSDTQDLYAPVEYYTISGVRVSNNPGPGIYIRRQGNTVTKVAIR